MVNYLYQSINDINELNLGDCTQPDIFFKSENELVAIELKLGTKSSIEQLLKYSMLFNFTRLYCKKEFSCYLIYVGCNDFSEIFKEKFQTVESLQSAMSIADVPDSTRKGNIDLTQQKEMILKIAQNMKLAFISYQGLYDIFEEHIKSVDTTNPFAETIIKLLEGMNDELVFRKLTNVSNAS